MRRLLLALLFFSPSFGLSITMTTTQKVKLTIPAQVTVLEVAQTWLQGNCNDLLIQFPTASTIYVVSGSAPCSGKLMLSITGTVAGVTKIVDDVVDVTVTTSRPLPAALTASAPEAKP